MERGTRGRRLLVWDAPNMDMCLSEVIGERPTASTRPDLEAVLRWMQARCQADDVVEACVFINVPAGFESAMGAWVVGLRQMGFAVFAKPKRSHRDDVDADIVGHIERRFARGSLVELVVASHDAKAFGGPLRRYAKAGVAVMVLGYREKDSFAATSPELIFVDLEDLNDVFERPLPRTNLFDLPPGGRWFEPFARPGPGEASPAGAATGPASPLRPDEHGDETTEDDPVGEPPRPEDVISLLAREVQEALDAGAPGLSLRDAGDLLRTRFPRFGLAELGFTSFTALVDALLERTALVLVRSPGAGTVITRSEPPRPPVLSARTDTEDAGPRVLDGGVPLILVSTADRSSLPAEGSLNPIYQAFGLGEAASRQAR